MKAISQKNLLGALLLNLWHLLLPAARAAEPAPRPNILLILVDDLGYGDIACYNPQSKVPTPNLDRLAAGGNQLRAAYAPASISTPTRYAMLTGRYSWRGPLKNGVLRPYDPPVMAPGTPTLALTMRAAGYQTACIGKWHLGWNWPTTDGRPVRADGDNYASIAQRIDYDGQLTGGPLAYGFDYYYGEDVVNYPPYTYIENDRFAAKPTGMRTAFSPSPYGHIPGMTSADWDDHKVETTQRDKVIDYLKTYAAQPASKPFFLYWASTAVHEPITPAKEFAGRTGLGAYEDYIAQLDDSVGQVVRALDELQLREHTMIIFVSDNGPRQGGTRQSGHTSAGEFFGEKTTNWEGGHRVPLIVNWPGHIPPGAQTDQLFCIVDLHASLAGLLAQPTPPSARDSENLAPLLLGRADAAGRDTVVLNPWNQVLGLRKGQWVYLDHAGSGGATMTNIKTLPTQLYDLSTDPGQKNNVVEQYPDRARELKAELERIRRAED
ncbi:MAG: sulfatase-like hydrolase/transferase [Verrucomicrobiales bacterium]|jgi:arylsulfatase A-like enzyme|nr:sulfatase-like hydrolase/transferase [Verrucomicrobiales bacterium]